METKIQKQITETWIDYYYYYSLYSPSSNNINTDIQLAIQRFLVGYYSLSLTTHSIYTTKKRPVASLLSFVITDHLIFHFVHKPTNHKNFKAQKNKSEIRNLFRILLCQNFLFINYTVLSLSFSYLFT